MKRAAGVLLGVALALGAGNVAAGSDEPPAGLTRDNWGQIRGSIQQSEYHASRMAKPGAAPALQAPNRQQRYRTTFRRDGIEIVPQAPVGASWRLGLSVTGYGYQGDVRSLESAEPQAVKERVEYRRGPVTEWYVNRPGGLEQGFELEEPKPRRAGPLVVTMAVQGDLEVSAGASGASFARRSGETLVRYDGLKAWDAEGRPLRSRLESLDREVRLVVEAQDARFPVTVDPTFVHEAQLLASDGAAGDQFGSSVSVSGDTVVIGAVSDATPGAFAGSAYVFVRSGTTWSEQQKLLASDGAAGDQFGSSVSVSGDTVVVGAPQEDNAGANAGSAYVFVRSGTTWTQQQKLLAPDGAADDFFGISVSISGDTVVAGAYGADIAGNGSGSAYVFVRSGTTWTQQQRLLGLVGEVTQFGFSVSLSGDTAVVGAPLADAGGGSIADAGAAVVFVRSGTTWTVQQTLFASDPEAGDQFGSSVSVSGNTAVVGAVFDDTPGFETGSAYVFVRSGTTWSEQQKLVASDGAGGDGFGGSVSLFGDTVVVGASADDAPGSTNAGSAYVFARSGTTWTQQQKLLAPDGAANDFFGISVSISGDTVVVGAFGDDTLSGADAGSAHVFRDDDLIFRDGFDPEPP